MYYWHKLTQDNKTTLEEELLSLESINEMYIGTAFISKEGINILKKVIAKFGLQKSQIWLYLSSEFSRDKPHELLEELRQICQVKLFFNETFHSKVYLIKGKPQNKAIFGSSNFTSGGYKNNIEFDCIKEVAGKDLEDIEKFFSFCNFRAIEVTDSVIKYYKDNSKIIEQLRETQRALRKKLTRFNHEKDALDPETLNIDDFYFNYLDYETFFIRNERRSDADIQERRKMVQDKMLDIHNAIYPGIKELGINCHWNKQHITSVIRPCEYNKGRVGWLGVRYGKSQKEVNVLNENLGRSEKDELKGFQKHGCLQFCIVPTGLEINIFIAVRHEAVDRSYLEDNIDELKPAIEKELSKLKGYGMVWEIYDDSTDKYETFDIDNSDVTEFCPYIKKHDKDGRESYLKLFYAADDMRIKEKNGICTEVVKYAENLVPLYNTLVWRPKV